MLVRLGPLCMGFALLRAQMCAVVSRSTGQKRKDIGHGLLHTLARTSLLCTFGQTGPKKGLLNFLRLQMCVAHSGGEIEQNCALLGNSALREKGGSSYD